MTASPELYRRVRAHPDYAAMRKEAEDAHAAMIAAVTEGDGEKYLGASLVLKGANDVITAIYDDMIAAMREGR